MNPNDNKPIVVFSGELWKASMIKEILEDNNIQVFLQDEYLGNGMSYMISAGGINPVKVVVSTLDYNLAIKIIADFDSQQ
jgi:hypothetical protein